MVRWTGYRWMMVLSGGGGDGVLPQGSFYVPPLFGVRNPGQTGSNWQRAEDSAGQLESRPRLTPRSLHGERGAVLVTGVWVVWVVCVTIPLNPHTPVLAILPATRALIYTDL